LDWSSDHEDLVQSQEELTRSQDAASHGAVCMYAHSLRDEAFFLRKKKKKKKTRLFLLLVQEAKQDLTEREKHGSFPKRTRMCRRNEASARDNHNNG
jgi:hypothetical protein